MALEGPSQDFGPFYTEVYSVVLDGGDRGLGNPRSFGELVLAQSLELAEDRFG